MQEAVVPPLQDAGVPPLQEAVNVHACTCMHICTHIYIYILNVLAFASLQLPIV